MTGRTIRAVAHRGGKRHASQVPHRFAALEKAVPVRRAVSAGRWAAGVALVMLLSGCQFGGYVPKGKHQPVDASERDITDLPFDTPTKGTLDCSGGRCRVWYRLRMPEPGRVEVVVDGPRGTAQSEGPRLARVVLQDLNGQVVGRNDVEDKTGAMEFPADVTPGPYFVLIQGLGGEFEFEVTARQVSTDETESGAAAATAAGAAGAGASTQTQPRVPRTRGAGAQRPGDTSDGADFAYDPRFDLITMRTYAFAQNPQQELEGEASEHGNPFVIRRIQREIRYALADRGVQQVAEAEADFLVSVQVGSSSTTWYSLDNVPHTTSYDAYYDRWRGNGAFVSPHVAVDGTLVIDFIDPKSGDLVWHGWTTEPINVNLDEDKQLKGAVKAVLSQYSKN